MCFVTDRKRYFASSDIKCWKFLAESTFSNGIVSPLYGEDVFEGVKCKWAEGVTKKSEIWLEDKVYRVRYYDTFTCVWKTKFFTKEELEWFENRRSVKRFGRFEILEEGLAHTTRGLYSFATFMTEDMKAFLRMMGGHGPRGAKLLLANAVIPAGGEYYISENGQQFISDTLRVDKINNFSCYELCF